MVYSGQDKAIGLAQQTAFGTAAADASAFAQLVMEPATIEHDVEHYENRQANRARHGLATDVDNDASLAMPGLALVGDAKLCGILTESRSLVPVQNPPQPPNDPDRAEPEGGGGGFCPGTVSRPPHFVVGIGLNVAQRHFPDELVRERAVTSLALLGREVGVETGGGKRDRWWHLNPRNGIGRSSACSSAKHSRTSR